MGTVRNPRELAKQLASGYARIRSGLQSGRKNRGAPPGTIVYVGEERGRAVSFELFEYGPESVAVHTFGSVEELPRSLEPPEGHVTWLNVDGIHNPSVLERLGTMFSIHPLTLEDIANTTQRPKIEVFDEYLFITVRMLMHPDGETNPTSEQVSLILMRNALITFQEQPGDVFDVIRERVREGKGRARCAGADYLAYALLDAIVDNYFLVLEKVGEAIDEKDDRLLTGEPARSFLRHVHALKRDLGFFRHYVWPLREVISSLQRAESELVSRETQLFVRDLYDHTIQVMETIDSFRDLLSGITDLYLSLVSNRMNETMRVLTVIATIFIPLTFIAGIYGMNFDVMPELHWKYGYPMVWGFMLLVGLLMLLYFRRRRWL